MAAVWTSCCAKTAMNRTARSLFKAFANSFLSLVAKGGQGTGGFFPCVCFTTGDLEYFAAFHDVPRWNSLSPCCLCPCTLANKGNINHVGNVAADPWVTPRAHRCPLFANCFGSAHPASAFGTACRLLKAIGTSAITRQFFIFYGLSIFICSFLKESPHALKLAQHLLMAINRRHWPSCRFGHGLNGRECPNQIERREKSVSMSVSMSMSTIVPWFSFVLFLYFTLVFSIYIHVNFRRQPFWHNCITPTAPSAFTQCSVLLLLFSFFRAFE